MPKALIWLPVLGGPCDGAEFYPPSDPVQGTRVRIFPDVDYHSNQAAFFKRKKDASYHGHYIYGILGESVVWIPSKK